MLTKGFKIVSPKTFEIDVESLENKPGEAVVKIEYAAICKADLRYYLGNRDKRILGLKYPMRLIHEATGTILSDYSGNFKVGDKVVLVPNMCSCNICDFKEADNRMLGVNYCPKAKFASSNYDGFSSECISFPSSNLIKYNSDINGEIAVFAELISVAISAIRRVKTLDNKIIGIWGDGILGYILAHVIKLNSKESKVNVIGKNKEKLALFNVENTYLIEDRCLDNIKFDLLFECVGGKVAEKAINQMIERANFGADIVLTGVSEEGALLNTRRILEKAVRITGSTRSNVEDFKKAIEIINDLEFRKTLHKLILSINIVDGISKYYEVFEKESTNSKLGKHIIKFNL